MIWYGRCQSNESILLCLADGPPRPPGLREATWHARDHLGTRGAAWARAGPPGHARGHLGTRGAWAQRGTWHRVSAA